MKLDNRMRGLIAVGAAVASNCQPCLQSTMTMARESGADEQDITEAIALGKRVRQGAASIMDQFVLGRDDPAASVAECRCRGGAL